MKIVLAALNAKYVHSNLAVYDIASYTKAQLNKEFAENKSKPDIVIREYTINHNLGQILQSLYEEKANAVAFSCYIWNIREILTIAKELHKVSPKTRLWLGGPEVSYDSKRTLEEYPFLEGIMQGEGETTFYELVKVWWRLQYTNDVPEEMGDNRYMQYLSCVKGIVYRDLDSLIHENEKRNLPALDEIPFVYDDLQKFKNKILYYETSRGCPFSCSYCLSSIDKRVRFRSLSLVERELQFFLDHKAGQVKFIDRTFNCKKEHALSIWKYLSVHDNGITNFHFEVAADLIGEEELEVFRKMRPGLIQLEIGLQSTNEPTIREIRRVMDISKLKQNMLTIRAFHNIHQHLDLIAGLPYEDFAAFKQSFNDAYAMKPNQLQLGFLKVLKGSYMEEQAEHYELKYQDSQPYEVLSTKWLSYDEVLLLKQVEEMVEVYYNSDQFEHVLSYVVNMFPSPFQFYEALGGYYKQKDLFGIGFRREMRYVVLRDFCMAWFTKENPLWDLLIFDSLLTFDYYLRENAKNRPSWNPQLPVDKKQYQDFFKNGGNDVYHFDVPDYDSKVAARVMHIEPVYVKALPWLLREGEFPFHGQEAPDSQNYCYCLFDYEKRNALTKDATVRIMSHL